MNDRLVIRLKILALVMMMVAMATAGCASRKPVVISEPFVPTTTADHDVAISSRPEESVHVLGAVRHPGWYGWTKGMTIADAIEAAGGCRHDNVRIRVQAVEGRIMTYKYLQVMNGRGVPPLKQGDEVGVVRRIF